jgi:hypothetical protein
MHGKVLDKNYEARLMVRLILSELYYCYLANHCAGGWGRQKQIERMDAAASTTASTMMMGMHNECRWLEHMKYALWELYRFAIVWPGPRFSLLLLLPEEDSYFTKAGLPMCIRRWTFFITRPFFKTSLWHRRNHQPQLWFIQIAAIGNQD